jgi:hypothetical protein
VTTVRSIAVVDLDCPSGTAPPAGADARTVLRELLAAAAADARMRLGDLRMEDRGDGVLLAPEPEVQADLLAEELVIALDARLHAQSSDLRARVALDQGPVACDDDSWVGVPVSTAFRLVNAPVLHDVLDRADRARVVVAVSDSFFRAVVRGRLDPSVFSETTVADDDGLAAMTAWVRVPGYSAPPGVTSPERKPVGTARPDPDPDRAGATINIGYVGGDVVGRDKYVGG